MNWHISLWYIIPAFFIILLLFPIVAEVRISFNPLFNRGVISLFVFKKRIVYYIVSFQKNGIELRNESETKLQKLEFSSPEFAVMEEFGRQIKDKLRLKKCYVFYNIGTGDAFSSAIVCGLINQILLQIFLFVKSRKPTASLCVFDTVAYNKEVFEMAFVTQVSISFFEIVYSCLYSVIISKKR